MEKREKHNQSLGRKIFLMQLQRMSERYETVESELLDKAPEKEMIDFKVPKKYKEAFNAYYLEFLIDHRKSTNTRGAFFDDEDAKRGISQKYQAFYQAIVNMLEAKYSELDISLHVVPEYESNSTIIISAENRVGYNDLVIPVVVFIDYPKAWTLPFEDAGAKTVYRELSEVFFEMEKQISKALSLGEQIQMGDYASMATGESNGSREDLIKNRGCN